MMVHIALSHPEISFKFIHNNKNKIYTSGNGKVKDIIYHIYGRDVAGALIPLEAQNEDVKVTGFVAKPYVSEETETMRVTLLMEDISKARSFTRQSKKDTAPLR